MPQGYAVTTAVHWTVHHRHLRLRQELRTARGAFAGRDTWLLAVSDGRHTGWGEAAPLPGFAGEDGAETQRLLAALPDTAAAAYAAANAWHEAPAAATAVLMALADLQARRRGLSLAASLAAAWGGRPDPAVRTMALLATATPAAAQAAMAAGHGAVKWKSSGDPGRDAADAQQLAAACPGVLLRLDVNGAWDLAAAQTFAVAAAPLMDYVEQPLPVGQEAELDALVPLQLRVALDESLRSPAAVVTAVDTWRAEVLVLKTGVWPWPALRRAVDYARLNRRRVVFGSLCESAVGRAYGLQAAAALGLGSNEHHGLATAAWLADDVAPAEPMRAGRLAVTGPGLGVVPAGPAA
jgi:o-succinylbenzoate synthase